jgi:hypothetical protein
MRTAEDDVTNGKASWVGGRNISDRISPILNPEHVLDDFPSLNEVFWNVRRKLRVSPLQQPKVWLGIVS